jgi:hypothetical protein
MIPSEILSALKQRTLEMDCVDVALVQSADVSPISYKGKGYIRQTSEDCLIFKLYATETTNTDKSRHLKDFFTAKSGRLRRDDEYYRFAAITSDGTKWTADKVRPFVNWGAQHANPIVTGSFITGPLSTEWPMSEAAHALYLHFFDSAEIPCIIDKIKFSAVNCDFVVRKLDNEFVVEACGPDVLPALFHIRIQEALRFLLARSVICRVIINHDGKRQSFQMVSASPRSLNTQLGRPIDRSYGYLDDSWRLFSQYLQYIINNTPSAAWNRCSYHLYNACEASANSVDAWAIGISVAVEGIARLVKSETPTTEERKRLTILTKNVLDHISSQPCFNDLVNRVKSLLGMMQNVSVQDQLKPLVETGYVDYTYIKAWSNLRNKHVHPSSHDLDMTNINDYHQSMIDLINKTTVLMYHIIFYIIGYKGKFTDYGTTGYPIKDYPLAK